MPGLVKPAKDVKSTAPVGVTSSPVVISDSGKGVTGTLAAAISCSVAGAGTGKIPWAAEIFPLPIG